jgi:hypothetical protein
VKDAQVKRWDYRLLDGGRLSGYFRTVAAVTLPSSRAMRVPNSSNRSRVVPVMRYARVDLIVLLTARSVPWSAKAHAQRFTGLDGQRPPTRFVVPVELIAAAHS